MTEALLIARLILGLGLAAHGCQKLFGWFGGPGLNGTSGMMEKMGFRPGQAYAVLSGAGELSGGLLTALGFLSPYGPALIVIVMVVAIAAVHWPHGYFAQQDGFEYPLTIVTFSMLLAICGPGVDSFDSLFHIAEPSTQLTWVILAVAVLLGLGTMAARPAVAATTAR